MIPFSTRTPAISTMRCPWRGSKPVVSTSKTVNAGSMGADYSGRLGVREGVGLTGVRVYENTSVLVYGITGSIEYA